MHICTCVMCVCASVCVLSFAKACTRQAFASFPRELYFVMLCSCYRYPRDAKQWDRSFPTAVTKLPSATDALQFYVLCNLHNVSLSSVAEVDRHIKTQHTTNMLQIDWQCGHCANHFAKDVHIYHKHVRLATAKSAKFAARQHANKTPLFPVSNYVFPKTSLQTLARGMSADRCLIDYNALQNFSDVDTFLILALRLWCYAVACLASMDPLV